MNVSAQMVLTLHWRPLSTTLAAVIASVITIITVIFIRILISPCWTSSIISPYRSCLNSSRQRDRSDCVRRSNIISCVS
jgi:hypothetical protein